MISNISLENNKKWVGWSGDVLFSEKTDDGIKGRNFAYKPVYVEDAVKIGSTHTVKIMQATTNSLRGDIVS